MKPRERNSAGARRAYDLLWGLGLGIGAPYLAWRTWRHPAEMKERFGEWEPWPIALNRPLWMHAASLGEVRGALPLMRGMGHAVPAKILSVVTPTAREHAPEALASGAELVRFAPADFGPVLARTFETVKPRGLLICETEVWPGLLMAAARYDVPVAFVNARLTGGGVRPLQLLGCWLRPLMRGVAVAAQSAADLKRWIALGVDPARACVTGNTKYAAPRDPLSEEDAAVQRGGWPRILVFGSIRSGEYAAIAEVVTAFARAPQPVLCIVAPRHPEHADPLVARLRRSCGEIAERLTKGPMALPQPGRERVLILRTIGELASFYALADLAFVGGTLTPIGGHNLFEAAECRTVVFYGEHTANVADVAAALEAGGGGFRVRDADELTVRMRNLLAAPDRLAVASAAARVATQSLGGAVERTIEALREWGFPLT